jgi:NhaP-type Na+/H+ or K+/H+ antiporter
VFNILSSTTVDNLNVFTSIALGIIAYAIGGRLHLKNIHKMESGILLIGVLQAIGALILSMVAIILVAPFLLDIPEATFINTYLPMGLVIGAIASATAPAAILALVREYRARGPLTTTLLSLVAIGIGGFSIYGILALPILKVLGSIAIGIAFGFAIVYLTRLVKQRSLLLVIVLGSIMLCVGVAKLLDFSEILSNMAVGRRLSM